VSTRVSNSLLVGKNHLFLFHNLPSKNHTLAGAIIGQVIVGLICDRIGRKAALVITTALIVLGATLATAAHGAGGSAAGLFWFLTVARHIIYPLVGYNLLMIQTGGLQVS
jgi:MFS family permease